jgi:hypothetical protein
MKLRFTCCLETKKIQALCDVRLASCLSLILLYLSGTKRAEQQLTVLPTNLQNTFHLQLFDISHTSLAFTVTDRNHT